MSFHHGTPGVCEHGQLARQCQLCELTKELSDARAVLTRLQWSYNGARCPVCFVDRYRPGGHESSCALGRALPPEQGPGTEPKEPR